MAGDTRCVDDDNGLESRAAGTLCMPGNPQGESEEVGAFVKHGAATLSGRAMIESYMTARVSHRQPRRNQSLCDRGAFDHARMMTLREWVSAEETKTHMNTYPIPIYIHVYTMPPSIEHLAGDLVRGVESILRTIRAQRALRRLLMTAMATVSAAASAMVKRRRQRGRRRAARVTRRGEA
jgi:hypothetical protein